MQNRFFKVKKIKPYQVVSHSAWEYAADEGVLKLDWNESTRSIPEHVKLALTGFIHEGCVNWYPDVRNDALLSLLANYAGVKVENVDYYAGSDAIHESVVKAVVSPGELVCVVGPTYDSFRHVCELSGAVVVPFLLRRSGLDFSLEIDELMAWIKLNQPSMVYICNPNNPTGTTLGVDELTELIERFPDVFFVIDEAYYEFTKASTVSLTMKAENLVVCRTLSKAFGLASLRFGYVVARSDIIDCLRIFKNPKSVSGLAQVGAMAALQDPKYMWEYVEEVINAKIEFGQELSSRGFEVEKHGSGNFMLVDFGYKREHVLNSLREARIFIRSVNHLPLLEGCSRITIGRSEDMARFLEVVIYSDSKV